MANPFDQFDTATPPASSGGNPFDRFDAARPDEPHITATQPANTPEPIKPEEQPDVNVGGGLFTLAAHAAQPVVDTAAGVVQHGASILHELGLPVDPEAAARLANDIRTGYSKFKERSQQVYGTSDEKRPVTSTAGDVAGQLLLYGATGPEFAVSKLASALPAAGRLLGKVLTRGVQGGILGGLQSDPNEDVGAQAFISAAGSAFGEGIGQAGAKAAVKVANSRMISRLVSQARMAAQSWVGDSMRLANGFKSIIDGVERKTTQLNNEVTRRQTQDILAAGGAKVTQWSAKTKAAMDKLDQHLDETKFLKNKVFSKLSRAEDETGGAGATHPKEANDEIIKYIMQDDRTPAKIIFNGMTSQMRDVVRKGIFYKALEKATNPEGNIDPVKLKAALSTKGVEEFFSKTFTGKPVIQGLVNLVTEGKTIVEKHPYILAHGVGRLSTELLTAAAGTGGVEGYQHLRGGGGDVERGAAEFLLFFTMLHGVNRVLGSQAGLNLLSAAGKIKPGTPQMGRALSKFFQIVGAPMGAATVTPQNSPTTQQQDELPSSPQSPD